MRNISSVIWIGPTILELAASLAVDDPTYWMDGRHPCHKLLPADIMYIYIHLVHLHFNSFLFVLAHGAVALLS